MCTLAVITIGVIYNPHYIEMSVRVRMPRHHSYNKPVEVALSGNSFGYDCLC